MKTMICGLAAATVLALGAGTASAQYPVYPAPAPVYQPGVVVGGTVAVPGAVVGGAYVAPLPVVRPVVNVGIGLGGIYPAYYGPRPYYPGYYHGGYYHNGYYHGGYHHYR